MQRLEGLMRKAIQEYKMIEPGDRICVAFPAERTAWR